MKKSGKTMRVLSLATVVLMIISIGLSTVYALPESTIKINGKIQGTLITPNGVVEDTIVIELKAKADGDSFIGSGSLHGINCRATFIFNVLTVSVGQDSITFEGTVSSSNTPASPFIGITTINFETDLSGDSMSLTINLLGDPIFSGAGSGKAVL